MEDTVAGTLRAEGEDRPSRPSHVVGHVVAPPLTATNDPSRSPQSAEVTAQVHAVLQAQTIAHVGVGVGIGGEVAGTLDASYYKGCGSANYGEREVVAQTIAFAETFWNGSDIAETLTRTSDDQRMPDKGRMQMVVQSMAVRRLTPRECERLQGFPDDYTRIQWKKKPADECPDGPRYKALGNSMAVPVMRWIGERIAKVEKV